MHALRINAESYIATQQDSTRASSSCLRRFKETVSMETVLFERNADVLLKIAHPLFTVN